MNIFSIDEWSSSSPYVKNSIVAWPLSPPTYWYATVDGAVNGGDPPSLNNPNWGGRIVVDGISLDLFPNGIPKFIWTPSYNSPKAIDAKVKQIQFGEGFRQVVPDGINNTLLKIDVTFEGRDIYEAGAILHFFTARQGGETFIWVPPSPYAATKKWKVFSWSDAQPFYNNYSIKTTFEEVLA
jgi:phage-related protein